MVSISMQDLNMRFHFGYYEAFGCSHGPEDFERVIEAMKILVTDGFVATNIGNAFYRNGFKYFDPDYLVFSGPCLHKNMAVYFKELFDCIISERKTKIILLGVGGYTYD